MTFSHNDFNKHRDNIDLLARKYKNLIFKYSLTKKFLSFELCHMLVRNL